MVKRQNQAIMFASLDEWEKSGKTMLEYCSDVGISKSCFDYWVRKKRDLTVSSPKFIELIPSVKPLVSIEQTLKTNESTTQAQIVFTFPGGLRVKVYG